VEITKVYFMVMVRDMTRAVTFYRNAFGLAVRFESPDWSELTRGDATIALHAGEAGGPSGLGFEGDDLDAACRHVKSAGGRIVTNPEQRPGEPIRLAIAADPDGNEFSLAEPSE
jgi:predicted enzyme related to lactoylglutathione lyase